MEAIPRLPMVSFELKQTSDRHPVDFGKLKQYIQDYYHEDPEAYATEIHSLESLRAIAVHPTRDVNGCSALKKYFCQLHFLQSRFPMGKDGMAAVTFSWKDAYSNLVCTLPDIKFEKISILYNIGALHSQLGALDNRVTNEGLKLACSHFQCAAWAFQHLKESYPQAAGSDVSPDLMQFMQQVCLAQAQECILEKSMIDNRKATINAKVAAQIVEYFSLALNALNQSSGPEEGCLLETVGAKTYKAWKKYVTFKQTYFGAISLLYQGMQSEEQQKMGERVAYFQAACDRLNETIKATKGLDNPTEVVETLMFAMDFIEGKKKAAKNENEFIYHEKVPERDELPEIKGAALVKCIPFSVNDLDISGPDIFAKLIPMKAHEVSSLYSEEKAKLLRKIGEVMEEKDEELVRFMSTLQLEHINSCLEPEMLPQGLIDRCCELSAKPDAIQNLIDAMDKLTNLYNDVDGMLKEILELIKMEDAAEKEYQEVMGSRPPSIVATDLTREANKYKEAHAKAAESNETLQKAMSQHIANLRVMSLPLVELNSQLPSLTVLKLEDNKSLKDVKMLLGKVEEMRNQRSMLASQLRESICNDDITPQLITRPTENFNTIFAQELEKHNTFVKLIEHNCSAQGNIVKALSEAYSEISDSRNAIAEIIRQRNLIITALMSSYDAYEDLITKSNKGLEFYRKLETNVTKLLQRVKGTCKVQEEEREQILFKNGKTLPSTKLKENKPKKVGNSEGGLKLKDYLANMKKDGVYPVENTVNMIPHANYNANLPNYGSVQISPGNSIPTIGYTESVSGTDVSKPWVPSVRPAPLGSEGSGTTKVPDFKSDLNTSSYPATANYSGYNSQYYNQPYYDSMKVPSNLAPSVATTSSNYQQPITNNTASEIQYNTINYPRNTVDPNQYAVQSYTSNPSNYQNGAYNQKAIQGYQVGGYSGVNSVNAQGTVGYPTQAFSSNSSVSKNNVSVDQNKITSLPNQNYVPSDNSASNYYAYPTNEPVSYPNTSNTTTTTPLYVNQTAGAYTSNNQSGYVHQPQVAGSYMYGGNYQTPNSLSYNWQQQQNLQTQPLSVQQPNLPTQQLPAQQLNVSAQQIQLQNLTNQQQYPLHYPTELQQIPSVVSQQFSAQYPQQLTAQQTVPQQISIQPQTSQTSISQQQYQNSPEKSATQQLPSQNIQPNVYTPYNNPSTIPGSSIAPEYSNITSSNASVIPTTYATSEGSQYSGYYNYYPPSYPQQYQYPPVPGTSHYTNASQELITSQTNSTLTSLQGHTFATQYQNPAQTNQSPQVSSSNDASAENYYSQQYGYQLSQNNNLNNPVVNNQQVVSPVDQSQVTPISPMTYMQASNSGLRMTFSQQIATGTLPSNDKNSQSSNVDLLAGLDFTVNETPLVPEQSKIEKPASVSDPVTPCEKPAVETTDEKIIEEKLSEMSIQSGNLAASSVPVILHNNHEDSSTTNEKILNKDEKSKLPPKDPFLDPDVLFQFTGEVEKFEKFVDGLTSKTLNGPTLLDIKWKELLDMQDKDSRKVISVARCYSLKNRFPDILPYDAYRVELMSTKDDYINASHVKDVIPTCPYFIITQSPMPSTFSDFWCMVLEQHIEIVVCLLNDMEIKDDLYWPTVKGVEEIFGKITVVLQSANNRKHWVERVITVNDGKLSRNIVHLQFIEWPGSSFPASPGPFLSLVSETLSLHSQQRGSGPITVHCNAGVGRSGLFIVAAAAICEIQSGHSLPDLITLVAKISSRRKNILHNREHFKFAYQTLLYYAQDLLMKRGILASRSTFEEKRPKSHTRHPSQDFLLGPPKENENSSEPNKDEPSETNDNEKGNSEEVTTDDDPLKNIDPMWPIKRYQ